MAAEPSGTAGDTGAGSEAPRCCGHAGQLDRIEAQLRGVIAELAVVTGFIGENAHLLDGARRLAKLRDALHRGRPGNG